MNKDEKTSITGRTMCTRSLAASTSASIEPGLRRSNRGTAKKLLTPASRKSERLTPLSSTSRKSKRLTPSPSASRKSERLTPSPSSQRSNKGKNVLAQDANRSVKSGRISDKSPESAQRKGKRKASEEESTDKIKKREPVMSARSYQALFRGKPKQSEAIVHASSNDEELVVVGCSRRVPAANDGSNSESKRLPVGETSLEKGTDVPLELIKDTETVVLDASPIVQTGFDSVIGSPCETSVGETSLEKGADVPLKLIKDTETMVLDASPIVETGDDRLIGSPSETSVGGTSLEKGTDVPFKLIKNTETMVLDPIVETGDDSVIGSPSETSVGGTRLEKGIDVPLKLITDTETTVLDASPIVETGDDNVIGSPSETSVSETSLEKGTDIPLKLIKQTETTVLDASPIVETGDDSVISSSSETSVDGTSLEKGIDVPLKLITDTEMMVLGASPIVETGDESVIGLPSETSVGGTSLEKGSDGPLKLIKDTETMVLDASPNVETGDDSIIGSPSETSERQKLRVSKNILETNIDLPLKRKWDTAAIVLDACATVANGDDCSMTSVGGTSLEKVNDVPLKLVKAFETMVLDTSLIVEAGDDSVIGSPSETSERQKLRVSKTSIKTNIDLPLKRKRDTVGIVLDACATVANGDDCVMSSDAVIPSPPGCKNSNQSETSSTCGKRLKVNSDLESVSSCIAKPIQESGHAPQYLKEPGPATSRDFWEKQNNMLQDKSHDPKLHLSMYPEFWIPVQLSDVQLEQYCQTLFCKYLSLSSLPKNEIVGALEETLNSVRKACDHPYVMDASLKLLLTKNLEVHEILDVEVKASGKFHLLEAMLNQIKKNGLKAVVFYQETQSKGGLLLGNMLEDFVSQKFGQISYEHGICSSKKNASKKNAIHNFNKESQCFVLLLEKRACNQSIKLLRAEAFILFGSSLNPQHDIKHIGKIKIESNSEKTKIFRLYSTCTIEEKALILAKQNKPVENLNRPLTHALLMWGASYLFDKLDHFHGSEIVVSGVPFEQSIMDGVISEFSSILSSNGGEENEGKLCLLLEAKHAHGNYRIGSTLLGEKHVKLSDEDSPHIFWKKLLEGKNPMWKYHSDTLQRNRKRVKYFQGSEESVRISNGGNTKKRKKAPSDVTDSTVENDNRKISGKDHMALQSASGANGTVNGDDAIGLYSTVSGIPEDMLAGKDWRQIPCESQRSLHAVLKLDMAKLGKVLNFSEDWTSVAQKFLEYVIDNYHICQKPATALQAFQMALSWIAASLVKHKLNREESLVRAKYELAFSCSREEVDYIYAMLYCMKSLFLESTQGLQVDFVGINSKQSMISMKEVNESLPDAEERMTEKRDMQYSSATKDINKTISDIKKKCKKKEQKLVQMHEEEKVELVNRFAHKKRKLETKKKLEAAILRITCSRISTQSLWDDLKRLDHDYERESDEITREKDECLKSLEQMHEAAKKKLAEDQACWISRIEKWARVELKKCVPIKSGNNKHFSGICSPNEWSLPKPQPFVVETRGSAESDHDDQDICHMPSSSAEKQPDPASNIQGQNIEAASEPQPTGSETVETGGSVALEQGDQVICPLPSSPAANQRDLAAIIEDQNIERSAEPHIAGGPDGEIGDTAVSDQDACSLPSALVGAQSDLAANFECQNTTTVVQLHTAGSDAVETGESAPSDKDANLPDAAVNTEGHNNTTVAEPHRTESDASHLPFSPPDAVVNSEGLNNTTMAEPHTIGSNASEMEIAEPGPQVDSTFANNLVHERAVEPSAAVTAPVPSLLNNSTAQSTAQPVPHTPFPVFNDPFLHELEKLRRESEHTKKAYEEKKSILKAELERKMAEVQAEFQRKLNEAEAEHNARAMENTKIKNRVIMNKLLANAFVCKCNDKNVSNPSAVRGRIQQLALRAAQGSSMRNNTAPAPAPTSLQPQASFPSSVPQPRQPLISNTAPSPSAGLRTNPVVNARLRSPTPQVSAPSNYTAPAPAPTPLQPQASFPSSVPPPSGRPLHSTPSPMPQPKQPLISNTTPSPLAGLATNPVSNARIRTPAPHLNAFRRSSSIPTATATLTSSPLPQTLAHSAVVGPKKQRQQQNSVNQGNNDVVWLSDNE